MTAHVEIRKTAAPLLAEMIVNVATVLVVAARKVTQGYRNRREAALLAGLDDRMLSDIGLTRGDLRDAFSEPLWRDPTAILVSRAEERRRTRASVCKALRLSPLVAPSVVPEVEAFCRPPTNRPSYQAI
jgi:uncharacterized protein YjiS (DUF1127 family)